MIQIWVMKNRREMKMNIKVYKEQPKAMMSTKEVAELTGKRHGNVVRDAQEMIDELLHYNDDSDLSHDDYQVLTDVRGYTSEILLNKELTETLITGYSVALRHKVIRRLHELESKIEAVGNLNIVAHYEKIIKEKDNHIHSMQGQMAVNSKIYSEMQVYCWKLEDKVGLTELEKYNHDRVMQLTREGAEKDLDRIKMESFVVTTQQQNRNVMLAVNNVMQIENKVV
ncbi:putative DNA-binding protein [Escherichia phage AugustePiccard]|uniref:DNA-binding protein n=1 Tax=Escherichia phage AugustePiccard TaxID=2851954 RepID=A0AAE7VP12_9CAUD|nr:putative DNA-binding protein [Escherichia phage AugustePiccard]